MPARFHLLLCQLSFAAHEKRPAAEGLRELIVLHDRLLETIDQCAIRYDGGLHPKHRLTKYHQFFVDRIEPGMKAIDIGCGIGAVAYSLANAGVEVTAVDIDEKLIKKAQKRYQHDNLNFLCNDVVENIPENQFNAVVLSNVLEHIDNRVDFLTKIADRLNPEIILIRIPVVNSHWLVPLKHELGLPFYSDATHFTEYTVDSFTREVQRAGLNVKHLQVNWSEIWAVVI